MFYSLSLGIYNLHLNMDFLFFHMDASHSVCHNVGKYFSKTELIFVLRDNPNIFSDLRNLGLVPGKNLSLSTKINSVLEKYFPTWIFLFTMLWMKFCKFRNLK